MSSTTGPSAATSRGAGAAAVANTSTSPRRSRLSAAAGSPHRSISRPSSSPKPSNPLQEVQFEATVPTVRDRVVMAAARLVLEPVFEADFLPVSYGFRPRRSAHQALEAIRVEANRGHDWVLDADVRDC